MRWTNDWRIYYVAALLFFAAGLAAWVIDGFGFRPLFGLVMAAGMGLIGRKAGAESGRPQD